MENKKHFLWGAFILAVAGGISKLMGAIYRIPLARLIGPEGMALYQMAYPIYTTILSLATAGVPVAISVLVSRRETEGYSGDSRKIFRVSLLILGVSGLILTLAVMQGAHFIADHILNEPRAYWPIVAVAPAIFFAGLMSVYRGYFQGYQTMMPTAVSQVIEQLFRVTAVLIFAYLLFPRGLEFAAAGATSGAVVGGIAGIVVLFIYYYRFRKKQRHDQVELNYSGTGSWSLGKEMVYMAIPVSFGAVVLPLLQIVDAIIVPGRLEAIHYSHSQAMALYGQLAGMASVLISLPAILTISIGTSLVPAVAEALARSDRSMLYQRINYALRAGMIVSLPCTAGLYILAYPISDLLYKLPQVGRALEPMAFACIVLAAFQISSAGLQGAGRPELAMRSLIITGVFKVIFNYTLTSVPALNIRGAALGTVLAFLIGSSINIISLKKITGVIYEKERLIKIMLVTVVMTLGVKIVYQALIGADLNSHISTLLAITAGVAFTACYYC
ncbi:putative polysaccharide biosynthesis protein [Syntrophomonas palmitatica]|uniref:putative polysaccharide biosynthesis protein n=1 Tax=Syntrophomonas palmitatica TaxID=402877 RepID=UPI000A432FA8|nr:polysaccharide biosynthesis protein [Syntrophomonas palmitatica]